MKPEKTYSELFDELNYPGSQTTLAGIQLEARRPYMIMTAIRLADLLEKVPVKRRDEIFADIFNIVNSPEIYGHKWPEPAPDLGPYLDAWAEAGGVVRGPLTTKPFGWIVIYSYECATGTMRLDTTVIAASKETPTDWLIRRSEDNFSQRPYILSILPLKDAQEYQRAKIAMS